MITLNDYNVGDNAGFLGDQALGQAELLKAIQAGQITGRDTTGLSLTQEPLKVESLEKTLKLLESRAKDIKLYNAIPKMTAFNTVEEFIQLNSYGAQRGGFYDEGELSDVEDSSYIRRAEHVKYIQITGEVTLQAQMVKSYVDAMAQEIKNKMMWVTRRANIALAKGDADVIPQEFNSIFKQHAAIGATADFLYATFEDYYKSGTVIDMRGKSIKQGDIEDGGVKVDAKFGNIDSFFAPTTVISALSKDYYQTQRIIQDGKGFNGAIGTTPKQIDTTIGSVNLMSDKYIANGAAKNTATAADSTKAPAAPSAVSVAVVSDALGKYTAGEAGNVYYAVAALNRFGESNLTAYGTAVALSASHASDITITPGTGANAATGYVIYITKVTVAGSPTGLDFYPIFQVSLAQVTNGYNGAAGGVVRDRGYFMADTEQAFLTEISDEVLAIKQLAPLSKLDLAVLSMSRRFIVFHFLCLQLFAPKKVIRYINASKVYNP